MGRPDTEPFIHHFSHKHLLKLQIFQPHTSNTTCSGCKLAASGWMYSCSACNYYLHKPCSQMPKIFKHPADKKHALSLLSSAVYPEGAFRCNACGILGNGFCYNCKECQLDIHTVCAFMPSSINLNTHQHTLNLCFSPPYQSNRFKCDICRGYGSDCWLYRCCHCDFDAHMNCAMVNIQIQSLKPSSQIHHQRSPSIPPQFSEPVMGCTNCCQSKQNVPPPLLPQQRGLQFIQAQYPPHPVFGFSNSTMPLDQVSCYGHYRSSPTVIPSYVQPVKRNNGIGNTLMDHVVQGFVDGLAQQAGQLVLQSFLGGLSLGWS